MKRRFGRIAISAQLVDDSWEELLPFMGLLVVVKAEHDYAARCFRYTALCQQFDEVAHGEEIPEYEVFCSRKGDEPVQYTFERKK